MTLPYETLPPPEAHEQPDRVYYSERLLDGVAATSQALRERYPEFRGVTMFGSAVRGEAGPDSDVDMYVYVAPDRTTAVQSNPNVAEDKLVQRVPDDRALAGTHELHLGVGMDYKFAISNTLRGHGVKKADIIVLPISKEIVDEEVAAMLSAAEQWRNGQRDDVYSPRNVRGLFHAPIDAADLVAYQRQVVDTFANSEHGEAAWQMMRRMIVAYEGGRNATDYTSAPWRYIPENLAQAAELYK